MAIGAEYLEIVLKLRRLVPGWVESYVGPPALASAPERFRDLLYLQLTPADLVGQGG